MMEDDITDSKSWPMLMTWETEGEDGILGMKRDMSATDASLIASSSTNELVGISCKTTIIPELQFYYYLIYRHMSTKLFDFFHSTETPGINK